MNTFYWKLYPAENWFVGFMFPVNLSIPGKAFFYSDFIRFYQKGQEEHIAQSRIVFSASNEIEAQHKDNLAWPTFFVSL